MARVALAKGAVQRHPAHHLGMREVQRLAAHLPDARVGLAPDATDEVCDASESAAGLAVDPPARVRVDQSCLQQVAVDVELGLRGGVVADSYRTRSAVPIQLECPFGCALAAVEAVENLQA